MVLFVRDLFCPRGNLLGGGGGGYASQQPPRQGWGTRFLWRWILLHFLSFSPPRTHHLEKNKAVVSSLNEALKKKTNIPPNPVGLHPLTSSPRSLAFSYPRDTKQLYRRIYMPAKRLSGKDPPHTFFRRKNIFRSLPRVAINPLMGVRKNATQAPSATRFIFPPPTHLMGSTPLRSGRWR